MRIRLENCDKAPSLIERLEVADLNRRSVNVGIESVKAEIIYHQYRGFEVKALLVSFGGETRRVLSTWDGYRRVKFVANVHVPTSLAYQTMTDYEIFMLEYPTSLGLNPQEMAFISTAADMDNVAICARSYGEFAVTCLATGGTGNAMRSGVDKAEWLEKNGRFEHAPGTINMLILSNMALSEGAMARAIITATEAKTAALQDLDVKSAFSPNLQATGTGTDNMIVVSGRDSAPMVYWTGGHTKMGELIAVTARLAVIEALEKQEGRRMPAKGNV
ncbi:MAG: adenosylcobinamide amidohydrolase [Candidatus Bathyarchaeia archaeon]